mmetsp:Transcript_50951/g.114443  ORF Transcript_50951/g.114443 Transcript_50951/m.114443 type:complete len:251 (-) Transcript_50951:387-1139(-)
MGAQGAHERLLHTSVTVGPRGGQNHCPKRRDVHSLVEDPYCAQRLQAVFLQGLAAHATILLGVPVADHIRRHVQGVEPRRKSSCMLHSVEENQHRSPVVLLLLDQLCQLDVLLLDSCRKQRDREASQVTDVTVLNRLLKGVAVVNFLCPERRREIALQLGSNMIPHDVSEQAIALDVMSFVDDLHHEALPCESPSTVVNTNHHRCSHVHMLHTVSKDARPEAALGQLLTRLLSQGPPRNENHDPSGWVLA